ncbi:transcriptional regulator [Paraburkholderia piptadeniae]|nr:transcriptional regulator [Paraburkholderia piptadeniae]
MNFKTVTADDLIRLKDELNFSSNQMADLVGLANGRQFRRYTSLADDPKNGRKMSFHMLFYLAARILALRGTAITIDAVYAEMRRVGAKVDPLAAPDSDGDPQP